MPLTDRDLLYAATGRCETCRAGLAYRPGTDPMASAWTCSAVLKADPIPVIHGHSVFPFAFWKVREETSINNTGGHTTRPPGTIARTVGKATCPECKHEWESEPYDATHARHHWRSGPCPSCGYAVGGDGTSRSPGPPSIEMRYRDVVIGPTDGDEPAAA